MLFSCLFYSIAIDPRSSAINEWAMALPFLPFTGFMLTNSYESEDDSDALIYFSASMPYSGYN